MPGAAGDLPRPPGRAHCLGAAHTRGVLPPGRPALGEAALRTGRDLQALRAAADCHLSPAGQLQVATALDMLAALEAHLDVLRRGLLDAARHLTGAKVLAERQYGVGPATALAMTCWLSGAGRFSSSRKAARFAGLDVTVWSSDRKPHAQSLEDVEAALTATLAAVGLPLAAVATAVFACRLAARCGTRCPRHWGWPRWRPGRPRPAGEGPRCRGGCGRASRPLLRYSCSAC
jgi:transposase